VYIGGEQHDSHIWSEWEMGFWRNDSGGYVCYTLFTVILLFIGAFFALFLAFVVDSVEFSCVYV
jgi:hypothetical protein